MKSLKLIGDAEIDADPLLHRRGSVLRDQHRQLLSLFRRFRLHGETMQRICRRTGQDRPPSDDVETSADGDDIWQSDDDVMDTEVTMRLHPASGKFVPYRKRARSRDEAGDSESDCTPEAVCVQSRGIPMASSSSFSASLHCAGKNTSDVIVLGSTANICGMMTGRRREDEDQAPACESIDDGNHSVFPHTTTATVTAAAAAAGDVAGSVLSVPSSCTLTQCVSHPVSHEFFQPATKKLRFPPPSPSLLSTSSGSPPLSPPLLPLSRPVYRPPPAAAAPSYQLPVPQQVVQQQLYGCCTGQPSVL